MINILKVIAFSASIIVAQQSVSTDDVDSSDSDEELVVEKPTRKKSGLNISIPHKIATSKHNLGVAAGYVSGFGLSYRQWVPSSNMGYQITLTPVFSENKKEGTKYLNASFGLLGLSRLHSGDYATLFLYYGGHVWAYENTYRDIYYTYDYSSSYGSTSTRHDSLVTEKNQLVQFGAGPGVELRLGHLSYSIMFGLRGGYDLVTEDKMIKLTVETSLYYGF
jgi:hypothetical protein